MAFPRPLLLALPVVASALAWVALAERRSPKATTDLEGDGRRATPAPPATPTPQAPPLAPPPEPPVVEDPEWGLRDLPSLKGAGSLKGSELIAAIEKEGRMRFRGATPADLEALRGALFEEVDRDATFTYASVLGWLKEAGFEVEVVYPSLVVKRRVDEAGSGR